MSDILCITFRFLHPFPEFHGRVDTGEPEWPPSPMRAFQALVNAASMRSRGRALENPLRDALRLLESVRPQVITPPAKTATVGYRSYVPHNHADLVSAAWSRGNVGESIASHRMEKDYFSTLIEASADQLPSLHYLYSLKRPKEECERVLAAIRSSVRAISSLGWGIDMVAADATLLDGIESEALSGRRWMEIARGNRRLRVSRKGSLDSLFSRHMSFLNRLVDRSFIPVPPLTAFDMVAYRRDDEPQDRPIAVFELRNTDGTRGTYPHRQLIHIAGMVRHLAIDTMTVSPPRGVEAGWVNSYIAGHRSAEAPDHRQLSYLPLPSIGNPHTDPGIRRVMLLAPIGDDRLLEYISRRLAGQKLRPAGKEFVDKEPPLLVPLDRETLDDDPIARQYAGTARIWSSFTPVILPGHDDHDPKKRKALIEKALRQSGVDQACEYEVSEHSRFRKSFSAHKYDKEGHIQGYIRPSYLMSQTAIHLTLRFPIDVNGPIAIGAGRHCGLGLFAPVPNA